MKLSRAKARVVVPDSLLPMEGFGYQLDELYVRLLRVDDGNIAWLLVSLELTSLKDGLLDRLKDYLAEACQLSPENIWISVTHTFSVPHISDDWSLETEKSQKSQVLFEHLMAAVRLASQKLSGSHTEVSISYATGETLLGLNRDLKTKKGWWLGPNPAGQIASQMNGLVFTDLAGQIQARVLQVSVPSSILQDVNGKQGKPISGDLFGQTAQLVEEDGSLCILLLGSAADQMPKAKSVFDTLDFQGKLVQKDFSDQAEERLRLACTDLTNHIRCMDKSLVSLSSTLEVENYSLDCPRQVLPRLTDLRPDASYCYQVLEGTKKFFIAIVKIGGVTLVGLQVEVPARFLEDLALEGRPMMVVTMINGGAKYLVPSQSYDERRYQAMNAFYAQGSYENVIQELRGLLESEEKDENWTC